MLKELDTSGRRAGGLRAAFGALPSGSAENTRLTILGIILRSCGLPEKYSLAKFCLYLKNNGFYDAVKKDVEASGKEFMRAMNNLFVSPVLRAALLKADPQLGNADALRFLLTKEFAQPTDISTAEVLRMTREVLGGKDGLPLTILVLDEVQIYVRVIPERTREVVEVEKRWASNSTPGLWWSGPKRAEFRCAGVQLDAGSVHDLGGTVRCGCGKRDATRFWRSVPRRLRPCANFWRHTPGKLPANYPPRQLRRARRTRTFWRTTIPSCRSVVGFGEHVLRAVDPAGTSAMLRAQLQIIHEALRGLAEQPFATVVPADFMFEQLQAGMVQQGVLAAGVGGDHP